MRDGWIVAGIALLLFLAMEGAYRGQHAVRQALGTWEAPEGHPYEGERWYRDFRRDLDGRYSNAYDPYRAWTSKRIVSRHLNVDSAGRRATVQSEPCGDRRVFMFGGSALWGLTARDSFTIPSLLARKLGDHGVTGVRVVNLGEPGYNVTQQTISLLLELRRKNVPEVAVYFHGVNDILTAYQNGRAGTVYNQRALEAHLERPLHTGLAKSSRLVRRVAAELGQRTLPAPDLQTCRDVAAYYVSLIGTIRALAEGHGFATLFFLQPLAAMSAKPLTTWERSLDPGEAHWTRECTPLIDSLATTQAGGFYTPLHTLFDEDTGTVFIDHAGHVTEQANRKIAHEIAPLLADALTTGGEVTQRTD